MPSSKTLFSLHPLGGRPVGSAQALEQQPQIFQLPLVVFVLLELAFVDIVGLFNLDVRIFPSPGRGPDGNGLLAFVNVQFGVVLPKAGFFEPAVLGRELPSVRDPIEPRVDHHFCVAAEEFRQFGVSGNLGARLPVGGLRLLVPERLCARVRQLRHVWVPGVLGGPPVLGQRPA